MMFVGYNVRGTVRRAMMKEKSHDEEQKCYIPISCPSLALQYNVDQFTCTLIHKHEITPFYDCNFLKIYFFKSIVCTVNVKDLHAWISSESKAQDLF